MKAARTLSVSPFFKDMKKITVLFLALLCALSCACSAPEEKKPALASDNFSVSDSEFVYFYVRSMQSALASYSDAELSKLGYDKSKLPGEQRYSEDQSWADVFTESAIKYIKELLVLCEAAREDGFSVLPSDGLDAKLQSFKARCEETYSVSFEDYLGITYFGYVSEEDYIRALELELLAQKYMDHISDKIYSSIDGYRIDEYIASNIPEPNGEPTKNIMVITLAKGSAKEAEDILSEYPDTPFDELAKKYSRTKDHLYENCLRGDMPDSIDSWLYAPERRVGDTEIVDGGDALYIVKYFADGLTVSGTEAQKALAKKDYLDLIASLYERFPVITNKGVIDPLNI